MIGKVVSHYKILDKLGEGGMGVVYKAHDIKLDRDVALKFLPTHFPVTDEYITRFELEAKAISALNHPHIATIYDVDEANGQKYIVLEYISGGTLKSKLRRLKADGKELSIIEVLEFGIQIAGALSHAHRHQLNELIQLSTQRYVAPLDIASIFARLGEHEQALEWLEKAYQDRFSLLPWLKLDPRFDDMHSDSRFFALLKKIGLER